MARPLARSHTPASAWSDIPALLMLGLGMLLYLALISYVPSDLPSWVPFSPHAASDAPRQNFIGPVGAIVAGTNFFFFGAASFLVAALLLGFGGAKLFVPSVRVMRRLGWMVVFVLCGACLAQLQPWSLHWNQDFNVHEAGGLIGQWFIGSPAHFHTHAHVGILPAMLGRVGAGLMLGIAYLCTLILMTGLHPIDQLARVIHATRAGVAHWREQRAANLLARATTQERLEMDRVRLVKEQRRLEKELRKQGVAPGGGGRREEEDEDDDPMPLPRRGAAAVAVMAPEADEFAHLPPPTITDNTVPSIAAPQTAKKKPSLAELFASRKGKKNVGTEANTDGEEDEDGGDVRFANYQLPDLDLLDTADLSTRQAADPTEMLRVQDQIIDTLEQFGIKVSKGDITKGPTITRYELYPAKGVRVDKIVSLERDIARATRAERINILAPIPGKDTVGIEIANSKKVKVTLRELLEGEDWATTDAKIPIALGKDVYGKTIIADLAKMPHCLVAGATGSGKSVCINSIISSILYKFTPEQLRFVMIDPKVVEMQIYNQLPHLVVPVVTDPKKVLLALRWVIDEMEKRYKMFAKTGVRNITGFNARPKPKTQAELDAEAEAKGLTVPKRNAAAPEMAGVAAEPGVFKMNSLIDEAEEGDADDEPVYTHARPAPKNIRDHDLIIPDQLPYIVVIVDELADLMQTAPADVESAIARITQMARAAGIHMIVATQTPRADVITGVIKANIPSRIAFQVASKLDSRVILDENGADRLLGQGDMLYLPPGTSRLVRAQGVLVTDDEIGRLVEYAGQQAAPTFESAIADKLSGEDSGGDEEEVTDEDEELVEKCLEIIRQEKKASTSMLQRRLRLGYTRAARIVDILENRGVLGPENGAKGREILVDLDSM